MQNAWRRSEELRVLNEIGQALSSTLEPDALLEKIYSEMQRLFDNVRFLHRHRRRSPQSDAL